MNILELYLTYIDLGERFQTNVVHDIPVKQRHNPSLMYTACRKNTNQYAVRGKIAKHQTNRTSCFKLAVNCLLYTSDAADE